MPRSRTQARMADRNARILCGPGSVAIDASAGEGDAKRPRIELVAYTGAVVYPYIGPSPAIINIAGVKAAAKSLPIRFEHGGAQTGIGHTESVTIGANKITASGVISRETDTAREVVASSKNRFPWQASVGIGIDEYEFIRAGQTAQVNGKTVRGPVYVIQRSTLNEISVVDLGADTRTSARVAARHIGASIMTFTKWLEAKGFSEDQLSEEQRTALQAMFDAEMQAAEKPARPTTTANADEPDDNPASQAVAEIRAAGAAEAKRISGIRTLCAGKYTEIETQAIAEGWSTEKAELAVRTKQLDELRASRAHVHTGGGASHPMNGGVIQCAIMAAAKVPDLEKAFDAQTLEAAHQIFHGRIGLGEAIWEVARLNGFTGRPRGQLREMLQYACPRGMQAAGGPSTIDIGDILSNVANKSLMDGFSFVEQTWRRIAAIRSVNDFKTVTRYRMTEANQYEKLAPAGEISHGTLGSESFSNKADTYAKMLSIDRVAIINDDLGAITDVPRMLGRGSALKLNEVFWTLWLANAGGTFFASGHSNYLDGAGSALGLAGLAAAYTAFLALTDSDGKPLGIDPRLLLVPPALTATAKQLNVATEVRDTTASTRYATANPWSGMFEPITSRYLSNAGYTGYSATAWYLLADPRDVAGAEVCFLNGQEAPTIETAEADFNRLGIEMRGYHDFGVALQDPNCGIKSAGS